MINKFFAFILLILLFPLQLVLFLIIYLEGGLPVLFKQTRIGIKKKELTIYKIRTLLLF